MRGVLIGCELIVIGDWIRAAGRGDIWEMAFDVFLFLMLAMVWVNLRAEGR